MTDSASRAVFPVRVGRLLVGTFETTIRQLRLTGCDVETERTHRGLLGSHYVVKIGERGRDRVAAALDNLR